ncbi:hypothetical protein LY28_03364 [Ruminiclostridium sufflavum DSM 19573]|uniref:Uncharacterized protein n=1 Tax=Ruminiclostridium sufflavum DSM 19573 TaxID=1121337 RepID=A0A318XID3_9FIRM|nr:hypothetical protein LY28_03364 [Ruminiclostridium sufflavum DSM 19573]
MKYHEACHGFFLQRAVVLVKIQQAAAFELAVEPLAKISRISCVNGQK